MGLPVHYTVLEIVLSKVIHLIVYSMTVWPVVPGGCCMILDEISWCPKKNVLEIANVLGCPQEMENSHL